MAELITLAVILIEFVLIKFRIQNAAIVLILIYCIFPISLGINIGIRLNIITLSVICFVFLMLAHQKKRVNAVRRLLLIYGVYIIVTSLIASSSSGYVNDYPRNVVAFLANYVLVGYFITFIDFDYKDVKRFNGILVALIIVISLYGVFSYLIKFNPYIAFYSLITDSEDMSNEFMEEIRGFLDGRTSSTFLHPLLLGQVSVIFFAYVIYAQYKSNIIRLIILLLLLTMCVLCGSRSALVPLVLVVFIYFIFNTTRNRTRLLLLASLVFIFGIIALPSIDQQDSIKGFLFFWDDSYSKEANITGSSLDMRINQFNSGLNIIKNNTILGFGQGYVSQHGSRHDEMLGYESFIFQQLIDGGILGLIVFMFILLRLYLLLLKRCNDKTDSGRVHALCLSYYINILFTGIMSGTFMIFMIFYHLTYCQIQMKNKPYRLSNYGCKNNTLLLVRS